MKLHRGSTSVRGRAPRVPPPAGGLWPLSQHECRPSLPVEARARRAGATVAFTEAPVLEAPEQRAARGARVARGEPGRRRRSRAGSEADGAVQPAPPPAAAVEAAPAPGAPQPEALVAVAARTGARRPRAAPRGAAAPASAPAAPAPAAPPEQEELWRRLGQLEIDAAALFGLERELSEARGAARVASAPEDVPLPPRLLKKQEEQALARLMQWGRDEAEAAGGGGGGGGGDGRRDGRRGSRRRAAAKAAASSSEAAGSSTDGADGSSEAAAAGGSSSSSTSSGSSSKSAAGTERSGGGGGAGQGAQTPLLLARRAEAVLIHFNMGLIPYMVKPMRLPAGLAWRDALQAGLGGLRRAAELFEPDGSRFSSYACLWIKATVQRAADEVQSPVRNPCTHYAAMRHCWMHHPQLFDLSIPRQRRVDMYDEVKKGLQKSGMSVPFEQLEALMRAGTDSRSLEAAAYTSPNAKGEPGASLGASLSSEDLEGMPQGASAVGAASLSPGDGEAMARLASGLRSHSALAAAAPGGGVPGSDDAAVVGQLLASLTGPERLVVEMLELGASPSGGRRERVTGKSSAGLSDAAALLGLSNEAVRLLKYKAMSKLARLAWARLEEGGAAAEELQAAVGARDVSRWLGGGGGGSSGGGGGGSGGGGEAFAAPAPAPAPAPAVAAAAATEPAPQAFSFAAWRAAAAAGVPLPLQQQRRRGPKPKPKHAADRSPAPAASVADSSSSSSGGGSASPHASPSAGGRAAAAPQAAASGAAAATAVAALPAPFKAGPIVVNPSPRWRPGNGGGGAAPPIGRA
ncbi:hypothetical protein Rsub_10971 [Raphidocelis subcapitata]|uniref:RNA polymerase sigma-70 region 2 domain-containing protein n=1 Tax=Raphidocelis subcapitata TaxID=307507 RepID=A0A2V0PEM1_9CHLO|nr:hypothetical protein Rsub_10971 [Raphidocelis subcapitata]|eukprot:GBF98308.1 hypothetical protein Rsub_10971 [Raphidocelis subcapitata]